MALSAEVLRERVSYDPETGVMTWRFNQRSFLIGKKIGSNSHGYLEVKFREGHFRLHRLAWLYVYGEWPDGQLDHINGIPTDNRISNLRIATQLLNTANRRPQGGRALKGISRQKGGRWTAQIRVKGKNTYLGSFDTPEEAHAVYSARARELHGEFARVV